MNHITSSSLSLPCIGPLQLLPWNLLLVQMMTFLVACSDLLKVGNVWLVTNLTSELSQNINGIKLQIWYHMQKRYNEKPTVYIYIHNYIYTHILISYIWCINCISTYVFCELQTTSRSFLSLMSACLGLWLHPFHPGSLSTWHLTALRK